MKHSFLCPPTFVMWCHYSSLQEVESIFPPPWTGVGLMTCFDQRNVADMMLHILQIVDFKKYCSFCSHPPEVPKPCCRASLPEDKRSCETELRLPRWQSDPTAKSRAILDHLAQPSPAAGNHVDKCPGETSRSVQMANSQNHKGL